MELSSIYPQYIAAKQQDRRQDNDLSYSGAERRGGEDRRNPFRPDNKLWNDITQIKSTDKDVFEAFRRHNIPSTIQGIDSSSNNSSNDDKKIQFEKALVEGIASSVPFVRRGIGCRDSFDNDEDSKGWGKLAILALNIPEDGRDIGNAGKQILNIPLKEGEIRTPNTHQVKFSFFRGTLLEPLICKLPKNIQNKLAYYDVSLYDTKFGNKLLNKLGEPTEYVMRTSRPNKIKGGMVKAFMLEGNKLSSLIGRGMMRVPVISVYAFSAFELSSIYRAFTSSKNLKDNIINGNKQLVKSTINVFSFIIASAVLGAFLASKNGAAGSLVGIGLGSYFGTKAGNLINAQVDKI
ncbi:MAG: hypothetical protein PHC34_04730 [Candidatus Gastranaerophilales bacterium]|nr:hypothetical protein [Candidatus Gastranaerophilales bacterium]